MIDGAMLLKAALGVAVVIVVYGVFARGLYRAAEPLRYAALDLAADLLASSKISERDKRGVERALDDLHSTRRAWIMALCAFVVMVRAPFRGRKASQQDGKANTEIAKKFSRFQFYWLISTVANSPLAALVFITFAVLATAFSSAGGFVAALFGAGNGPHDHHNGSNAPPQPAR